MAVSSPSPTTEVSVARVDRLRQKAYAMTRWDQCVEQA